MAQECIKCGRMRSKVEALETREKELRDKLRDVRVELASRDRQLEVARRMLARLGAEKTQLEASSEQDRLQLRRAEQRLAAGGDVGDMAAKMQRMRHKMTELKEQLHHTESRLALAEETNMAQSREVSVLKGALGLKSDLMSDGMMESQAKLLHALSKAQEDASSLAVALAEKEGALAAAEAEAADARADSDRLVQIRMELEARCEDLHHEVEDALETAGQFRRESEGARMQQRRLEDEVAEAEARYARLESNLRAAEAALAAQQDKGRMLETRLTSAERASRLSIEALRTEVSLAVERSESRSAEARAGAAVREAQLGEQLAAARQELEDAKAAAMLAARDAEQEAAMLRTRLAEAGADAEDARAAEREKLSEVARLQGQLEALTEANRQLKSDLVASEEAASIARARAADAVGAADAQARSAASLGDRAEELEGRLRQALAEATEREDALNAQVNAMRSELATSSFVASRLQAELVAARGQAGAAASKYANVDSHISHLQDTVQQLSASKTKLQATMLEQLSSFRSKLTMVEEENRQLRAALGAMGMRPGLPSAAAAVSFPAASVSPVASPSARYESARSGGASVYDRARVTSRARGYEDDSDDDDDGEIGGRYWRREDQGRVGVRRPMAEPEVSPDRTRPGTAPGTAAGLSRSGLRTLAGALNSSGLGTWRR